MPMWNAVKFQGVSELSTAYLCPQVRGPWNKGRQVGWVISRPVCIVAVSTEQQSLSFLVLRNLFMLLKITEDRLYPSGFFVFVDYIHLHLCERLELRNWKILSINSRSITANPLCPYTNVVLSVTGFQNRRRTTWMGWVYIFVNLF